MIYILAVLILITFNSLNKTQIIKIKNIEVNKELKDDLKKIWSTISSKENSFIDVNIDKRLIVLKGGKTELSEFEKFFYKLDKKPKSIKFELKIGFVEDKKSYGFSSRYSSIYNRNQTIKNSGKNFDFTGLGGNLLFYPEPQKAFSDFGSLASINNINLFSGTLLNAFGTEDILKTNMLDLPLIFGGPNLRTAQLSPRFFLNETNGTLKEISKPELIVANKETAKLLIANGLPIYTTVSEKTGDNTELIYGVQHKSVGFLIQIKPIIDKNKNVTLEILLESTLQIAGDTRPFAPDIADGILFLPPVIEVFRTFQRVRIKKNESLILSGFSRNRRTSLLRKIPILYKIPLLGKLFQQISNQTVKEYGVVLITPTIID